MKHRLNLLTLTLTAALLSATAAYSESVSMNSDGTLQIENELRADFKSVGLDYPDAANLTFGQIEELLVMFAVKDATPGKPTSAELAAKADNARLILSRIATAQPLTYTNPGAMQIGAELKAYLDAVGLAPPSMAPLTLAQIRELYSLFKTAYKSQDKPTSTEIAAVTTSARLILARIEHPTQAGNDSPAVQTLKYELKMNMEAIGVAYPNKDLTLNQVVALHAVFDTPDTAEIKGASDPMAARAKVQSAALADLLAQM